MRKRGWSIPLLFSVFGGCLLFSRHAALAGDEILGPEICQRGSGAPSVCQYSFAVAEPDRGYVLRVYNGGLEDALYEQVSSSVVTLNGIEILGPGNFNQSVSYLEIPVALQMQQNILHVEVRGKPGGALVMKLYPFVVLDEPKAGQAFAAAAVPATGHLYGTTNAVSVNGVQATVSGSSFSVSAVPLAEGKNVLTATAFKGSALLGNAQVSVLRDTIAPAIGMATPSDGAVVAASSIDIAGTVDDAAAIVIVDGTAVPLVDASFVVHGCDLQPGANVIPIEARDALGNSSTLSLHVTYAPPLPTAVLSVSPNEIVEGGSGLLQWATSDATAVSITPGIGSVPASGSLAVSPTVSTTYQLTALGPGGAATAATSVLVSPPFPPSCPGCPPGWYWPPTATLSAAPPAEGEVGATLIWAATDAATCWISGGVGAVPCSGSMMVAPAETTTFTLTAVGPGGIACATALVTVGCTAPTANISAEALSVPRGTASMLSWNATDATTCAIAGIGAVACDGTLPVTPIETTLYALEAAGPCGVAHATVVVEVEQPPPALGLTADPPALARGGSSVLSWTSADADACSIAGVGPVACAGSLTVQPETTTTYTLSASGPGGSASASATVSVTYPPPTAVLSAAPSSIVKGSAAVLTWIATDADGCSLEGVGAVDCIGSMSVLPESTMTYALLASGPGGEATATRTVTVSPRPPTASLTLEPATVLQGNPVTLSWTGTDAESCAINWIGAVPCSGSTIVTPSTSKTYTLAALGPGGEAFSSVTAVVTYAAPTVSLTLVPATIAAGGTATLAWQSTSAVSANIDHGLGSVPVNGAINVSPTESTTYVITAVGAGGTATATATVVVVAAACFDVDGDQYSPAGGECGAIDCADSDPAKHPGATEIAGDGIDQDCDGTDLSPFLVDADHDLFGPFQGDCDDDDPGIFPGATDFPQNGIDEDCDGKDAVSPRLADRDFDGFTAAGGDCDDTTPGAHPGAQEIPCNGIDDDCDGADACDLSPAETPRSGYIHGEVFDARTKDPIAGAAVMVARVGKLLTDGAGKYVFPTPDEGVYVVLVEKPGYTFAQRRVVVRTAVRTAAEPVVLVPLDASEAVIDPGAGGTLLNSTGDVELFFEPAAVTAPLPVSATRFAAPEELPGALPETSHFTMAVELKPDGATFVKPVRLRVENTHRFAPATPVPVGHYRKDLASWIPDGMAKVTADGKWVEYWVSHFTPFDINVPPEGLLAGARRPDAAADQSDDLNVPRLGCQAGNAANCRVVYRTGDLMEDYALPAFSSLGRPTTVRLMYASDTANPKAVIATNYSLLPRDGAAVPETTELKVNIAGKLVSAHFAGAFGALRQAYLFEARDDAGRRLPTGAYPYHIALTNWYPANYATAREFGGPALDVILDQTGNPLRAPWNRALTREYAGRVIVNNLADSHFGAGWNVDGISRLHLGQPDGVVLIEGSGAKRHFAANVITTAAGKGWGFTGDGGPAVDAALAGPASVCVDGRGNVFFADVGNYRVRKIDSDGIITTVAGNGLNEHSGDGGPARLAGIGYPQAVAVDAVGNLYIADAQFNRIRKVAPGGIISTIAGNGESAYNGDDLPATEAAIHAPSGIAIGKEGDVYFSDMGNSRVRKIDRRGIVTTVAGNGEVGFSGDGGPAALAALDAPGMIALDDRGVLYVADYGEYRIRKVDPDGTIATVAGNGEVPLNITGDGGPATEASLGRPMALAVDGSGNILIGIRENRVRKVDAAGVITTIAGTGTPGLGPDGVPATAAALYSVSGLAVDVLGTIYASDYISIRRIAPRLPPAGEVVLASPPGDPSKLTRLADGSYALREKDGTVTRFDGRGLQTSRTDANGNVTSYSYDAGDRITRIEDPVGQAVLFQYSGGRLTSITDPAGRATTFAHDAAGNLAAITGPDEAVTRFSYDADHMLIGKSTSCCTTVYTSDRHGFIESVVSPDGSVREYSPSNARDFINDLPAGVGTRDSPAPATYQGEDVYENPFGYATRMITDRNGRLLSEIDPLGEVTAYTRNEAGLPTRIEYPDGTHRSLNYDARGNLLSKTDAHGNAVFFGYEPLFENIGSVTDALGSTTTMAYDSHGNLSEITLANGFSTTMAYDGRGLLLSASEPLGVTAFAHDSRGNVTSVVDPGGKATSFEHDAAGNVTAVVDSEGKRTEFTYDQRNRLTSVVDAAGHTTSYAYDGQNLTSVTDARGKQTRYEYSDAGHLSREVDPLGYETAYGYGPGGVVRTVTDPMGHATTYEYDPVGRLVDKTYPDGTAIHYGYDVMGNLAVADNGRSRISFEHDGNGRLIKATTAPTDYQAGGTISYAYDANGNRVQMTDTGNGVTSYAYDAMNLLVSLTNPLGQTTHYSYDEGGRFEGRTFANGMHESVVRDASGNVSEMRTGWATQRDPVLELLFERSNSGMIAALHAEDGIHNFAYDGIYRLVQAGHSSQALEQYAYDAVGNRLASHARSNGCFDDGNRLLGYDGIGFVYDQSGNLASKADQSGTTVYSYDYENRLARIDYPDGKFSAYAYDPLGRRIWTNEDGLITKFVYDGGNVLQECNDDGSLRARYTFGPGLDEIISAEVPGQAGTVFYLTDHLGSVRWLADSQGSLIAGYRYDSFGNVVEKTGNVYNPYGYTGRVLDEPSGLMYYRARYYDPSVGRFTTKDPIGFAGGDTNLYAYVSNDPVNWIDPSGLYESQTHYIVARDEAVSAGMPRAMAEIVGRASGSVDTVYNPKDLRNRAYHFSDYGEAQARVDAASTPKELGIALHTLMDVYTHEGRNPAINGIIHVWQSRYLDAWDPNSARDRIMAGDIGTTIRNWMRAHPGCNK